MNIFDIIGPIMIGPSSSHTAGVVRIGNIARIILDETPKNIKIKFHGSFATTYKGHGSDKAIIAGLMGYTTADPEIKNSLEIAKQRDINFTIETINLDNAHPNTVIIEAEGEKDTLVMYAESIGGGSINITRINGIKLSLNGENNSIIIPHTDHPGVIASVTNILAENNINISGMNDFRSSKGGESIMTIEIDNEISRTVKHLLDKVDYVNKVIVINALKN